MGGRYLISGAQIGTIIGLIKGRQSPIKVMRELREIQNKQFIGNSEKTMEDDVERIGSAELLD